MENKITLYLENFRCWPKLNIEFEPNEIILLKGDNGVGKSTILNSIYWILYGKVKNIAPSSKPKAKTRGILNLGFMIIERYTSPCTLKVTIENKIYDGEVAQNIIVEKFGSREVWLSSCYILQDCRNSFLSVSNKEKIDLLNKIAFSKDDPTEFINKIDTFTIECNKEYELIKKNYEKNNLVFENQWKNLDFSEILEEEKINNIKENISNIKINKKKLIESQVIRKNKLEELSFLDKEIEKLENCNYELPNFIFFEKNVNVEESDNILSEISETLPQLKKLEELKNKVSNIEDFPVDKSVLEEKREELIQTYMNESIYNDNKKICDSLSVPYDKENVEKKIIELKDIVESQNDLIIYNKIKDYKIELDNINIVYPLNPNPNNESLEYIEIEKPDTLQLESEITENQNEINNLFTEKAVIEQKIKDLKNKIENFKNSLPCPHCNKLVKYLNGKIFPLTDDIKENYSELILYHNKEMEQINLLIKKNQDKIITVKDKIGKIIKNWEDESKIERNRIERLNKKIHSYQLEMEKINTMEMKKIKISDKIKELEKNLGNEKYKNKKIYSAKELDIINSNIRKLKDVVFMKVDKSSHLIKKEIEKMELQMEKCNILSQIQLIEIPKKYRQFTFKELEILKINFQKWIKDYHNTLNLIQIKDSKFIELKNKKEKLIIPNDESENIIKLEKEIEELKNIIEINDKKVIANKEYIKILELRNNMDNKLSDLADLKTIKKLSTDTKCESLDKIAEEINIYIDEICSNLFEEPLSIELSMNKKLKSGNIVQKVNLVIDYRNCQNVDFDNFSGGEKTKISLALTIALNNISNCPLLLLDEIYGPLKPELREEVTKAIKAHSLYKTIICISHDNFNDAYDSVIDLDTFSKKREVNKVKPVVRKTRAKKVI